MHIDAGRFCENAESEDMGICVPGRVSYTTGEWGVRSIYFISAIEVHYFKSSKSSKWGKKIGKVSAIQALGPEFRSQHAHKTPGMIMHISNPGAEDTKLVRQEVP